MKTRVRFPGLNGVRFVAALLVIVDHGELMKARFGFEPLWPPALSARLGAVGVTLFFVLSGFLITHLLLHEDAATGRIRVSHFYMRRILRIWPLYYLLIALGFFVLPHIEALRIPGHDPQPTLVGPRLPLFALLMANVAFAFYPIVAYANILWSVAVEEQFYLLWPHLMRVRRHVLGVMLAVLGGYLLLEASAARVAAVLSLDREAFAMLVSRTRISCMVIGGLAAYAHFHGKKRWLAVAYHRGVQWLCLVAFFVVVLVPLSRLPGGSLLEDELLSCLAACGILNVATNPRSILKLEARVLDYLGRISYGLYVYHLIAIVLVLRLAGGWLPAGLGPLGRFSLLGSLFLAGTVALSALSYWLLEAPLLRHKARFSSLITGDQAQPALGTRREPLT